MVNPKSKILKALFSEAKKLGIDQETLREDVAPGVIGKRLSAASSGEVARVLVYIHNKHGIPDVETGLKPVCTKPVSTKPVSTEEQHYIGLLTDILRGKNQKNEK